MIRDQKVEGAPFHCRVLSAHPKPRCPLSSCNILQQGSDAVKRLSTSQAHSADSLECIVFLPVAIPNYGMFRSTTTLSTYPMWVAALPYLWPSLSKVLWVRNEGGQGAKLCLVEIMSRNSSLAYAWWSLTLSRGSFHMLTSLHPLMMKKAQQEITPALPKQRVSSSHPITWNLGGSLYSWYVTVGFHYSHKKPQGGERYCSCWDIRGRRGKP